MDEAVDWIGVLSNVHGLLGIIYGLWYERVTGKKSPYTNVGPAPADAAALMDVEMDGPPELIHAEPAAPELEAAGDGVGQPEEQEQDPTTSNSKSPEENEKTRATALRFTSMPTMAANTVALRLTVTPVFNFMHSSLDQGGPSGSVFRTQRQRKANLANIVRLTLRRASLNSSQ